MLKKIDNEINNFTENIKEENECNKLLGYMSSDYFSSIKLLMSISRSFSLYGRLILFLIIASTGLLMSSTIGVVAISSTFLGALTLFLLIIIVLYISYCKQRLMMGIKDVKHSTQQSQSD